MAFGLGVVEAGAIAAVIIAAGVAARYYRHGGVINVDTAAGDIEASSDGDDHYVDLSADGEAEVTGALESDGDEDPLEDLFVTDDLTVIEGVGPARSEALRDAGFEVVEQVADAEYEELTAAEGIGLVRAESIGSAAQDALADDTGN